MNLFLSVSERRMTMRSSGANQIVMKHPRSAHRRISARLHLRRPSPITMTQEASPPRPSPPLSVTLDVFATPRPSKPHPKGVPATSTAKPRAGGRDRARGSASRPRRARLRVPERGRVLRSKKEIRTGPAKRTDPLEASLRLPFLIAQPHKPGRDTLLPDQSRKVRLQSRSFADQRFDGT
jgi:hypothetical protein